MRSSGGTGTEAIMYLYIIACLSSSFHCAFVKGNPKDPAILPAAHTIKKHTSSICLRQYHLYSLSLININKKVTKDFNFALTSKEK
jgi:hypothetical protein